MNERIKIRCVGVDNQGKRRDAFWSAGIRFPHDGRILRVIEDEPIPTEFLRPKTDNYGNLRIDPDSCPENAPIPLIPRQTARCMWDAGKMYVVHEGHKYRVPTELDLPEKDGDFQQWAIERRAEKLARKEISMSDYAQVRADHLFLAVEHVEDPVAPKERESQSSQQQQNQGNQGKRK